MEKKYIEIVRDEDNVVVHRMDVTEKSISSINRIESGVNINLNHNEFTTRVKSYDKEMPESDEVKK